MKKEYKISITGCDDETNVSIELDDAGFAVVYELSQKSHEKSTYDCMPTITIEGHEVDEQ